jgi:MFS family permease
VRESIGVWRKLSESAFYLFLVTIGINGLVVSCYTYFVVYAVSVLGVTESQWAFVMAFMYLSVAIPGIIAGLSMDIKGRKTFLILGYLLYAPGMLLFLNADFNMLLLAFFFYGLGNTMQLNSYQVLMGDMIPKSLRGTANGCIHFFMYLIQAILKVIIGFIYAFVSHQLPFLILAAMAVPFAAIIAFKVSEPKVKEA